MVASILYFIVFVPFVIWFWRILIIQSRQFLLPLLFSYLGFMFLAFFIGVGLDNEYLEFSTYLVPGVGFILAFWFYTLGLIMLKNKRDEARRKLFEDIAQTLVLPLVVALIWFWFNGQDFKIGG